jgi:hypothetical protein
VGLVWVAAHALPTASKDPPIRAPSFEIGILVASAVPLVDFLPAPSYNGAVGC